MGGGTGDGLQRKEYGVQSSEYRLQRMEGQGTEDGVQSTEYRLQRTEGGGQRTEGVLGDRLFPLLFGAIGAGEEGDGWDEGDG